MAGFSNSLRTLKDVMQEYQRICWCPTSNNYPALYYLSELYGDHLGLTPEETPDLFVISDLRPPVNMGFYVPEILGSKDWQNAGRIYPERCGDQEYTGLPFSVEVTAIERLKDVRIRNDLSMDMGMVRQSVSEGWGTDIRGMANTDGRCFYMHVSVHSDEAVWETALIYVFADPLRFATDFLLYNGIHPQFISYGTYQQGFDGLDSGRWLSLIIPLLKPSYMLADMAYLNGSILKKDGIPENEYEAMENSLRPLQIYDNKILWVCRNVIEPLPGQSEVSWNARSYIQKLGFYKADILSND